MYYLCMYVCMYVSIYEHVTGTEPGVRTLQADVQVVLSEVMLVQSPIQRRLIHPGCITHTIKISIFLRRIRKFTASFIS